MPRGIGRGPTSIRLTSKSDDLATNVSFEGRTRRFSCSCAYTKQKASSITPLLKVGPAYLRPEPPTTQELMERRKQQQEDAQNAWEEYEQRQRDVDSNMARLRAERLAREKAAAGA